MIQTQHLAVLARLNSAPDVTAPTLSSATIEADGTTWTFVFDETVNIGAGGNGGWSVTMTTAGSVTLTYASGDGTSSLVYTGGTTVDAGDTVSAGLDYTQPGDGIEDNAGNDLASISGASVTNNSTQGAAPSVTIGTVLSDGDTTVENVATTGQDFVAAGFSQESTDSATDADFGATGMTNSGSPVVEGVQSIQSAYLASPGTATETVTWNGTSASSLTSAAFTIDGVAGTPAQVGSNTNAGATETSIAVTLTPSGAGLIVCWLSLGDNVTVTSLTGGESSPTLQDGSWVVDGNTISGAVGYESVAGGSEVTYTFNFPSARRPCMQVDFIPTT